MADNNPAHGVLTPELFTSLTGRTAPSQMTLDAALDVILGYCRWPVLETTRTTDIESHGGRVLLLRGQNVTAVSDVTAVADYGSSMLPTWRFTAAGVLRATRGHWPRGVVTVTFTSGYAFDPAPGGIWLTVAALAERVQLQAGVTQRLESAGGVSTNTSFGGMEGFMLANPDLAVSLDQYRLLVGPS